MEPIDYGTEYAASLTACAPLDDEDQANAHLTQERITHDQRTARRNIFPSCKKDLMKSLRTEQGHEIEMASEKRASNWRRGLSELGDGLCVRYNIEAKNTPINCPCGEMVILSHVLHCAKGSIHIETQRDPRHLC